jgi:hypothetical protein
VGCRLKIVSSYVKKSIGVYHRIILDDNMLLKSENHLVFARDLLGTPWLALIMTIVVFLILLAVGLRSVAQPAHSRMAYTGVR